MKAEREVPEKPRSVVMVLPAGGMCGAAMIPADADDPVVGAEAVPPGDPEPDEDRPKAG